MRRLRERIPLARARLGGKCIDCGSIKNLEFDHIDPKTKKGNVSEIANWKLERFLAEVDKCVLRCAPCHQNRHRNEAQGHGEGRWGKRNCKCEKCIIIRRKYYREYMRNYRRVFGR